MSKKKVFKTTSRRNTPWTETRNNASPLEMFIDETAERNFAAKHALVRDSDESRFLNSYEVESCPYCGSTSMVKNGKSSTGINRYKCKDCEKRFNILTGTIFQDHRIPIAEWVTFCMHMINYQSFTAISNINLNSYTTTRYWISKIFMLLKDWQDDIVLDDIIYIDEPYYSVRKPDIKLKPDGTHYRGLSMNKMCIGIGCDVHGNVMARMEGLGKTSMQKTLNCFDGYIKEGAYLIHDEEKAHKVLISKYNLKDEIHKSRFLKGLSDTENPLNPVNQECNHLKQFLHNHRGFLRKDIDDYLNLFVFIRNKYMSDYEKVECLLDRAICTREVLKYRVNYHVDT